jgi:sulfur-carrier protein
MQITVRYFASLREALGAQESVDLAAGCTVAALRARLIDRSPAHAKALAPSRAVRCAVDQVMADESLALSAGAEVAFFPPVTGG